MRAGGNTPINFYKEFQKINESLRRSSGLLSYNTYEIGSAKNRRSSYSQDRDR